MGGVTRSRTAQARRDEERAELERRWFALHPHAKSFEDHDGIRASRIGLITAEPSQWEVGCDGCDQRSTHGVALLALATDLHFCRECLLRVREVVDQTLRDVA